MLSNQNDKLLAEWEEITTLERQLRERKASVRNAILQLPEVKTSLREKPEGARDIGSMKLTAKLTRKWDNKKLLEIAKSQKVPAELWPFETTFKEVRGKTKLIEESFPQFWAILSPALSVSVASPTIEAL